MPNGFIDRYPPVTTAKGIREFGHSGQRLTFDNTQRFLLDDINNFLDAEIKRAFNEDVDIDALANKHREGYQLDDQATISFGPNFVLTQTPSGYSIDVFIDFDAPGIGEIETSSTMTPSEMAKFMKKKQ